MYAEQFIELIDELEITIKEKNELKKIISIASNYYFASLNTELPEKFIFTIKGMYIDQTNIIKILGIEVAPKKWIENHVDYGDNPFGPSDSVSWTTTECETVIVFPVSLFKTAEAKDVYSRIRELNNK